MNQLTKDVLLVVLRYVLLAIFSFLAAKKVIDQDMYNHLWAGDTVELWKGGMQISLMQIINWLMYVGIPGALVIGAAVWAKIKSRYRFATALRSDNISEVRAKVAEASPREIVKVANSAPTA